MTQQNGKNGSASSSEEESSKGEPILSPLSKEFELRQHPGFLPPQEVIEEIHNLLMPTASHILDRLAFHAKRWGMDISFHASNGIVFALRSSEYVPGGKAKAVEAINRLLEAFDSTDKEELKKAVIAMRDAIISSS